MGGISQLPKCPPRQLPGSVFLVQQDRSLPRGISLARDPGTLALVPEPSSVQSCAPAFAGMGWGDENGSSMPVLSNAGVSQSGTLLLQQSLSCCAIPRDARLAVWAIEGRIPVLGAHRCPLNTGDVTTEWLELSHAQPDSDSEE